MNELTSMQYIEVSQNARVISLTLLFFIEVAHMSPSQCRAARAMLGWSQADLAERAKVAKQTLADFERGARRPYDRTLCDIQRALEQGGISFLSANEQEGEGIRLRL